jgi:hypothetical protein
MAGVQVKLKCMFDMETAVLGCVGEERRRLLLLLVLLV